MNVYIGNPVVVSDMQWPSPDGFHVPLKTEWNAIYNAGVSLWAWSSSNGTNFATYLMMPMAGYRSGDKSLDEVGSYGEYWSSSPDTGNTELAYYFYFGASIIRAENSYYRSYGYFIRCFKNSPVIPTTSWTKLYWTDIESWWIFWNSADWLISISLDGTTRYTLMDKNLWATTVYNYWDTLTDANCGNVFQWWNNYAFPWTKSSDNITSSSTKVDASSYWPWNYYKSSTWIVSYWNWSSTSNNNLRWWVSQWSWTKSVEVKNIYIGDGRIYKWEYIEYKMNADSSWNLYVPTSWIWYNGDYWPSYSWKVSVDGWIETTYSWTGSNGWVITLSWYTANTEHLIKIAPVTEEYWWARAYSWGGNSKRFSLTEVVYDSSYMWYALSESNTGTYFRYWQYRNCNITSAPNEYLPDTVTTILEWFRDGQYRECTYLTYSPEESLPSSVTSIGIWFRQNQYYSCNSLTEIKGWKDLNIGGPNYRSSQYYITNSTDIIVKVLSDVWYAASNLHSLPNARVVSVYVPSQYLTNFKNTSNYPRTMIDDSKFIWY